ncbi:MAG: DUF3352 domain-containing protein [Spirochaetes bacterium]|nr:DUF3352 domain-containing protein [Spirochaetota bacterium]
MALKKKHITGIVIVLISMVILINILYLIIAPRKSDEFIDPEFRYFLQSRKTLELIRSSDQTPLFNPIIYDTYKIYTTLTDIKIKLYNENKFLVNLINSPSTLVSYKDTYPVFIFETGIKNIIFKFYLTLLKKYNKTSSSFKFNGSDAYRGFNIYHFKILYSRQIFYISLYRNLLLFSISKKAIKKSIDSYRSKNNLYHNDNYLQVKANIANYQTFRIYINTGLILSDLKKSNYTLYRTLTILKYIPLTGLSLDIRKHDTLLKGFSSIKNIPENRYKKLFTTDNTESATLNLLPETTAGFTTLSFKDFKTAWYFTKEVLSFDRKLMNEIKTAEEKLEQFFKMTLDNLLFSWLGSRITVASIYGYKKNIILLKIKDFTKARIMLKKISDISLFTDPELINYGNYKIYRLKFPLLLYILTKIFNPDLTLPYYTIWKGHFLISENEEVIKHVIKLNYNDELLLYSNRLFNHIDEKIRSSNVLIYWNKKLKKINFLSHKNMFSRILNSYTTGLCTLKITENGILKNFYLQDQGKDRIRLIPNWPVKCDGSILGTPLIRNINASRRDEIIFGESSGKISVFSIYKKRPYGWPITIENKLKFPLDILYHPLQDKYYIIAVSKKNEILIINYKGKLIKKISHDNDILFKPIIKDIDHDNVPDITFIDKKKKVHSLNATGETINGFPFSFSRKKIKSMIITNLTGRSNSILINSISQDNKLHALSLSGGRIRTNFSLDLAPGLSKQDYFLQVETISNKKKLLIFTGIGEIYIYDKTGMNQVTIKPDIQGRFNNPLTLINIKGKEKFLMITRKGTLIILNIDGTVYLKKNFYMPPVPKVRITCFDINKDGEEEIMIPFQDNYIYVMNKKAKILFSIRGSDSPVIRDIDYNGSYEILTKLKNRRLYFYKLP